MDEVDEANDYIEKTIAATLAKIRENQAAIQGVSEGECKSCGEEFARLVFGKCGFCRDGRRKPNDA